MQKPSTTQFYQSVTFRLQEYIDAHIQCDITPDQLSDHVYVSKDHLTAIFGRVQQESIGRYIKRSRLERAAVLMTYTRQSLSQVADKVGYSGKHALSKAFNQHFGSSPGQFRKKLIFLKNSPNSILDGVQCEDEYLHLIQSSFSFHYRIEEVRDYFTLCRPLRMVPAFAQPGFSYEQYQQQAELEFSAYNTGGQFVVRPFDSLNFTSARDFSMHHGLLLHKNEVLRLPAALREQYLLCAVRNGHYLVFDIPAGDPDAQVKRYTTLFRENLIGRKRLFDIGDFCTFLLPGDNEQTVGQFYIFLRD